MPTGSNQMLEPGNVSVAAPYTLGARSGVIAAGLAGATDVFSLRNLGRPPPQGNPGAALLNVPLYVSQIRLKFASITAFTGGGFAFEIFKVTGFSAQATGGTSVLATQRKTSGYPPIPAAEVDAMILNTAALVAGTYTINASAPFDVAALGGSGTFPAIESVWQPSDLCPLILEQNEGLIIRNSVAQAAGTGFLFVGVDFLRQ